MLVLLVVLSITWLAESQSTYHNPILPGWHSDPSCVVVRDWENTTFCTTSSFLSFPGCPIYSSLDLVNWRLASNALNRPSQLPQILNSNNIQSGGIFASTLRFHDGTFYLITTWLDSSNPSPQFLIFTTTNPYDDDSWGDPIYIQNPTGAIDPDIFWDSNGKIIVAFAGSPIQASYIDMSTGNASTPFSLWNGTGFGSQEGPHLYKKDDYYYLLVAEGGTQYDHSSTIARARSLEGPWESSPSNPLVTARFTQNYFQTVGHSDLFQDMAGNWWGVALATRGGPSLYNESIFPLGRETVLYPVEWPKGGWPTATTISGSMKGPLPEGLSNNTKRPNFYDETEIISFRKGSSIPRNWLFWRAPAKPQSFTISPPGHPNSLRLTASRANLTGDEHFQAVEGLTFVSRRQTASFFEFSIEISPSFAKRIGDEAGVTLFLNQNQHVDLGILYERGPGRSRSLKFRFRATALGVGSANVPKEKTFEMPSSWLKAEIRLKISSHNTTHGIFSAASVADPSNEQFLESFSARLISGDGAGTGGLLGIYATTNGGNHTMQAYVKKWTYVPIAQQIDYTDIISV